MRQLLVLFLVLQTSANRILELKKQRKNARIQQRRKPGTRPDGAKYVDPDIFAK